MLPIVQRELRVASRQSAIYRWRVIMGILSAGTIALLLLSGLLNSRLQYYSGHFIFASLLNLAVVICILEAIRKMADAVSMEKREGTLGLLFLTDLKGYEIIFGKFAAHSLRSFHLLLAFLPVLSVTLLLGGTTLGQFGRAAIILLNTLFVSLATALLISTLSRNRSGTATLCFLFFILIFPLPLGLFLDFVHPGETALFVKTLSPFQALWLNNGAATFLHQAAFWGAILSLHLLGWFFLGISSLLVSRVWQDKPMRPGKQARRGTLGSPEKQLDLRRKLLDQNPAIWLLYSPRDHRFFNFIFFVTFGLSILLTLLFAPARPNAHLGAIFITAFALKIFLASQSSLHLASIRANGAFELLLSTPLTIRAIESGQWAALRRTFGFPALLLLAWLFCLTLMSWDSSHFYIGGGLWSLAPILNFGCALFAIPLCGMWMGLTQRSANIAFFKTILLTMVLPAILTCVPTALCLIVLIFIARKRLAAAFAKIVQQNSFDNARLTLSPLLYSGLPPVIKKP